jgi:hypothetical protein
LTASFCIRCRQRLDLGSPERQAKPVGELHAQDLAAFGPDAHKLEDSGSPPASGFFCLVWRSIAGPGGMT